ncbi:MAG: hypothetical protein U0Q11_00585 [Vicinamibacterales bacterium]
MVNATVVPLQSKTGAEAIEHHPAHREHHRARAARRQLQISDKMASIGLLAAGVAHGTRHSLASRATQMLLEQADASDRERSSREDRTADVPRREDRQRAADAVAPRHAGRQAPRSLNSVINDVYSLLEHQFEIGRIKCAVNFRPNR